jgi:hypothetical protein
LRTRVRLRARLWAAVVLAATMAIGAGSGREAGASDRRLETEHLAIEWIEGVSDPEVAAVAERGEALYPKLVALLGQAPAKKIAVHLAGPGLVPNMPPRVPNVDMDGRVTLYRFEPGPDAYTEKLAHELVHVFRIHRAPTADWFFEEAFAELVSLRVSESLAGFPWYDTPIVVAAGQWLAAGEDIPLTTAREQHWKLQLGCRPQAYTLRTAFFDWLARTYGEDALLRMARQPRAGELADYAEIFGAPFAKLEARWRTELLEAYRAYPDVDAAAVRYRAHTPIQYQPVCTRDGSRARAASAPTSGVGQ